MKRTAVVVLALASTCLSQSPPAGPGAARPAATQPSAPPKADEMLRQLLQPNRARPQVLEPIPDQPTWDETTQKMIPPKGPNAAIRREGTYIVERVGRLTRTPEGQPEFTFEADGQTLADPPIVILPNLKLMALENAVKSNTRSLRFRITGYVTEYNQRNYVLLEKVVIDQDPDEAIQSKK